MSTEVTTALSLATGVCNAASSLINVFSSYRQLRRKETIELKARIEAFKTSEYMRHSGELIRASVDEIERTYRHIESKNLTGTALKYAMGQFELLNEKLSDAIRSYHV
ncbi:hypothetical protein JNO48_10575 [Clostridiales bacterium]|nr:hypothetical protein JNO48_10575 [Clostridiales bacterium]